MVHWFWLLWPVSYLYGVLPPARWLRPTRGLKARRMTRTRQDFAARRRGELHRERASRRLLPALNAHRSLSARTVNNSMIAARVRGRIDTRYAYLTQQHD